jgi:hypothetical protein
MTVFCRWTPPQRQSTAARGKILPLSGNLRQSSAIWRQALEKGSVQRC